MMPVTSMCADRIVVMTRFPEPGRTKTRLIPALGADRAAALHRCLIVRTLEVVCHWAEAHHCDVEVRYAGGDESQFRAQFGLEARYSPQSEGALGERMNSAVAVAFSEGAKRVVVIGTDCPGLDASHLTQAFEQLTHRDVAIGPATDGGYYLLGMRRPLPTLFENIVWGTETVLRQTLERAAETGVTVGQLPLLSDVDYAEDLIQCRRIEDQFRDVLPRMMAGRISIIIPTLNEAAGITATLEHIRNLPNVEVIVADGGSHDQTVELARLAGATVVRCNRGRGKQMNAGAALASGEVLLFLHADTKLPDDFADHVWRNLGTGAITVVADAASVGSDAGSIRHEGTLIGAPVPGKGNAGGAFKLHIGASGWMLRLIEFGANLRSRWLQLPYGDQAIFVKAADFFRLNGFRNWPLMEDYDFCRRLRKTGRIAVAPASVTTSARRWQRLGVLRTTMTNLACVVAFRLGVSPVTLARWYRRKADG